MAIPAELARFRQAVSGLNGGYARWTSTPPQAVLLGSRRRCYGAGGGGGGGASGAVRLCSNTSALVFGYLRPKSAHRWEHHHALSSTGADLLFIKNVGYVTASGVAQVSSTGDYSGTATGAGGTATCPAVLAVPTPATPAGLRLRRYLGRHIGPQKSIFSTPGQYTFTVPPGVTSINYLVVGGGGGGGGDNGGPQTNWGSEGVPGKYPASWPRGAGGGGAGGVRQGTVSVTPGQQLSVVVGADGAKGVHGTAGGDGGNSQLSSIIAHGGGGGGSAFGAATGRSGGSGGGGMGIGTNGCTGYYTTVPNPGGSGISGEGNSGGNGSGLGTCAGGGGGGAGATGANATGDNGAGAQGGSGITSSITGSTVTYACGGGGGASGAGGCSSAGAGGAGPHNNGGDALAGSGSGGGGSSVNLNSGAYSGGKGGSGIVVLAWTGVPASGSSGGSGGSGSSGLTCNPATGNLQNACGQTTTCPYGCSPTTNTCNTTCQQRRVCDATGTKVVNLCGGAVVKDCSRTGQLCVAGQCISPPIEFESFDGTNVSGNTFRATGHLQVMPSLVKKGDTTRVYWKVAHASACTVLGSNGDGALGSGTGIWNMVFSGVTGKTTSAIMAKTTYTHLCRSLEGASPPTVQETATVNVLPSFQEL